STCTFYRAASIDTLAATEERRIALANPRVSVVDLSDAVCATPVCEPMRDSVVLYSDRDHLTAHFSRNLAATLGARLKMSDASAASGSHVPTSIATPEIRPR